MKEYEFKPILISGHCRSGTNWLLTILDLNPRTHCRNEPDRLVNARLYQLPGRFGVATAGGTFGEQWDYAVREASEWCGGRDHQPRIPKRHLHKCARRRGLHALFFKRRYRRLWNMMLSGYRGDHWYMPR